MINRGKVITLLIEPTLLEAESVEIMNKNKVGRRFEFSQALISAAFIVKCALRFGYRELQGFMEDVCRKLRKKTPNFRTIWWRVNKMEDYSVKFDLPETEPIIGAIDATGLRPINDGEYYATKYGKMRDWIKLHAIIDIKTKQILNVVITKSNVHDSKKFEDVVKPLIPRISAILADKGYDSGGLFEFCVRNKITPLIPVRWNSKNTTGKSRIKRGMIEEQLGLSLKPGSNMVNRFLTKEKIFDNQKDWKIKVGYGRRSIIESEFSRYKLVVGESLFSKKMENIEKEIITKVNLLNKFMVI